MISCNHNTWNCGSHMEIIHQKYLGRLFQNIPAEPYPRHRDFLEVGPRHLYCEQASHKNHSLRAVDKVLQKPRGSVTGSVTGREGRQESKRHTQQKACFENGSTLKQKMHRVFMKCGLVGASEERREAGTG